MAESKLLEKTSPGHELLFKRRVGCHHDTCSPSKNLVPRRPVPTKMFENSANPDSGHRNLAARAHLNLVRNISGRGCSRDRTPDLPPELVEGRSRRPPQNCHLGSSARTSEGSDSVAVLSTAGSACLAEPGCTDSDGPRTLAGSPRGDGARLGHVDDGGVVG
eukprot:8071574-Pyramimonas_sp.AAC.1